MQIKAALLAAAIVSLASCTGDGSVMQGSVSKPPRAQGEFLVLTTPDGVGVVDAGTGDEIAQIPHALAAPDSSTIAAATPEHGSTMIQTLDAATGATVASSTVNGASRLRAVSPWDGSLALTPVAEAGSDPWAPVPRSRTHLTLAVPGEPGATERFTLHGNFEPEAFSNDGESLYMLQYRPAMDPTTYRVTRLYIEDGKVWPVFGRNKQVVENMTATRLQQTLSPTGSTLYTLYTNQPPAYLSGRVVEEGDEVAFIHTLDLEDGFAVCVELPESFGSLTPEQAAIAAAPVGRSVYAVDARDGRVVVMDRKRLELSADVSVDMTGIGDGPVSARVSADGSALLIAGSDGIVALDGDTLAPISSVPAPSGVTGMAFSDDGADLFVSWQGGIGVLDPATLETRAVLPSPVPGALEFAGATEV
jgi:hypothetical protein